MQRLLNVIIDKILSSYLVFVLENCNCSLAIFFTFFNDYAHLIVEAYTLCEDGVIMDGWTSKIEEYIPSKRASLLSAEKIREVCDFKTQNSRHLALSYVAPLINSFK